MSTCLSGLWDVLIEYIVEDKYINSDSKIKDKIYQKIISFFEGDVFKKPEHIVTFCNTYIQPEVTLKNAASEAIKYTKTCALCMGCISCSQRFYRAILDFDKIERPLPQELFSYFRSHSQFYYYLSAYKAVKMYRRIDNTFICLKGFASTTPAIYSAAFENACTGGGLYFNVDGCGVVIDPGLGFAESMHQHGIFIEDVNVVLVTHNHLDHNADVGTLSALQYDINSYYEKQTLFYQKFFQGVHNKKHEILWMLDKGTKESTKEMIEGSSELLPYDDWYQLSEKVYIKVLKTKHMKKGVSYGVKFRLHLKDRVLLLGYTSDTRYFAELGEFFADSDLLLLNISDVYEKDVRGRKSKSSHLGFDGSVRLLLEENLHPQLAIVSEFCCNNGDNRMKIVQKLKEQVHNQKLLHMIPGEIGLKVDLETSGIYCSRCKRVILANSGLTIAPEKEFGSIQYICETCSMR